MNTKVKAYLAYAYIAIIWGTTYFGIRVAVQALPPFFMAATRQLIAFIILAFIAIAIKKKANLSIKNLSRQALIGFLMITIGNGVVSYAERSIPSGVAALICSLMPIAVVFINLGLGNRERLNGRILWGLLLGLTGVALIFRNDLAALQNPHYLLGILGTLMATIAWAGGNVLTKKWNDQTNPMFDAALQLGFGGMFLMLGSPLLEDYQAAHWGSSSAWFALAYLCIFGSVIAFTAYRYALAHLPVSFVTSYAYINPMIAVIIGYFAGENLGPWTMLSFIAIISGVALVNYGHHKQRKHFPLPSEAQTATIPNTE
ncbi:MAG: EamA family transporter [Bacteroidetes bacterium]|nr:EamA family transporter [Bacteroidota bacterium]